ncbi:MAG TPA: single-stranded-DNA-specific exonuclease RecJ, partial [bacterium (Candidatus Stahlbacteria)]|nr:single-stranded-DNA-specific exonuclease RecJ [Candidatus Stahlbacteria bacterium]
MREWILKERAESPQLELSIPDPVLQILVNRGYDTREKIYHFLYPSLSSLHDPFKFRDMEKVTTRILDAIKHGEKILIFGDYDVDGVTGTGLLNKVLTELGGEVYYYLPHRIREGYGFSMAGVEYARKIGSKLIITVDCGITAFKEIDYAKEKGIDIIICDHHTATERPKAYGVLDPKLDEDYPFSELAGCGVAFKLAQALNIRKRISMDHLYQYLDLVAIGTISDVAPLIDENRIITRFGLEILNKTENLGLRKLIEVCGISGREINTYQVGFIIGPRINAAGRIAEAEKGLRLLLTRDSGEAYQIATELDQINRDRKEIEDEILDETKERIVRDGIP